MRGTQFDLLNMRTLWLLWGFLLLATVPPVAHGFFFAKTPTSPASPKTTKNPLIPQLERLITESQNGVDTSTNDQVKALMTQISATTRQQQPGTDQRTKLPGQWELIYTTEREVNFFKTSWPFAKVESISQVLDLYDTKQISNSILFVGGGAFVVQGTVAPIDKNDSNESPYDRVAFTFTGATARLWNKDISLPPVGTGWFDTMYVDDTYRLSQDLRGDWSVFRRI
jgi:hypothetical protein